MFELILSSFFTGLIFRIGECLWTGQLVLWPLSTSWDME